MNDYIKAEFEFLSNNQKEILVALLTSLNYEGFEEEGDLLKAYIPAIRFDRNELETLAAKYDVSFSVSKVDNENWNQLWESNFAPVIFNHSVLKTPWLAIRAEFHQPIGFAEHEIIITPKMSFGTGHHATTAMVINMMSTTDFIGKKVLDFGTGTGILAIISEKLGAHVIVAIDRDDQSLINAAENFELNNCGKIQLMKASSAEWNGEFDIILANIIKSVILDNLSYFANQLNVNGILIFSGILADDETELLEAARKHKLVLTARLEAENWICLGLIRARL
jgi:ribosomal protein L11 methyltransferase